MISRPDYDAVDREEYDALIARLIEAERLLQIASRAIDDRLSGLSGDPLQEIADEVSSYWRTTD